jgi:hypothetical protein
LKIIKRNSNEIIIKIPIEKMDTFLETEEKIMDTVNEIGRELTKESIMKFDENEKEIMRNDKKLILKGKETNTYQTPYGKVNIEQNKYQDKDKKTYYPLKDKTKIIENVTPKIAKTISNKYLNMSASDVQKDLKENHNIEVSKTKIQNLSHMIEKINNNIDIEYKLPEIKENITTVTIGIDGTCSYVGEGYRETMVGTISLYDKNGNRKHTIYIAEAPEYGKLKFKIKMTEEIEKIKKILPKSINYVGLADGAQDNWTFLEQHINEEILDFYHVTEYLAMVSKVINKKNIKKQQKWLNYACDLLKNNEYGALILLKEMETLETKKLPKKLKEDLERSITYFDNHYHQMDYKEAIDNKIPIGSGVTESACKLNKDYVFLEQNGVI